VEKNFLGTGIRFPLTVTPNKKIATAVGEESIKESIFIILGTAKGERVMRPNFGSGLNELIFAPNDTATASMAIDYVTTALQTWEPRIKVEEVNANPDSQEPNRLNIDIDYKIIATNTKRNLVYPFYLDKGQ